MRIESFEFYQAVLDDTILRSAEDEHPFMVASVDVLKEAWDMTRVMAHAMPTDDGVRFNLWTRNDAVLGGLMIRLYKLGSAYLDQICQKRQEIARIIFRCIAETVINLEYLITQGDEGLFDDFVEYSLREEKKLLEMIQENVRDRGRELPIERRMIESIEKSMFRSVFPINDVQTQSRRPWGDNIFGRAKAIGRAAQYVALIGLPSHSVHGNWQDLLFYDLTWRDGEFEPNSSWTVPRPQEVLAVASLYCSVNHRFLGFLIPDGDVSTRLKQSITQCDEKVKVVSAWHEDYLQRG